ncbi:outer membrane beta-barrel protein [Parachlamydia sp. AcF125]|uniref:outer membrane beta-barrel protein n=1 Tax=Parachlamydia sp. AcF125 TaxID=2795736 RepID=UPI001BD8BB3E|nr:outer membrane beta-barrel protein [Parachlamydia sp. AcF125]MBS4167943.1 hypothetical protein [Parachlamydia sp. AcF125]
MMRETSGLNLNKVARFLVLALLLGVVSQQKIHAKVWGKVDFGPAYVHIDVLNSNRTVKRMDLIAYKADASIIVKDGWCVKPSVLYGANQGDLFTASLGVGHCFPIGDKWVLTPAVGIGYSFTRTTFKMPVQGYNFIFKERFRSYSPYISMEATYRIRPDLRVSGQVQYSWSRTHTTIKQPALNQRLKSKDHTSGPSYAAMLEYDLSEKVSINAGAAYNRSLSEEKHGIRGYGAKVGLAYWF